MDALLSRRLDRLKSSSRPTIREDDSRAPPDHATALAVALNGHAERGNVLIERSFEVPVDRLALGSLPYPAGTHQPLVCLDLETTGLATAAGTLAFLVGLGFWEGDVLTVRQVLLPDHAAEAAWLDAVVDSAARRRVAGDLQRPDVRLAATRRTFPAASARSTGVGRPPGPAADCPRIVEAPAGQRSPGDSRAGGVWRGAR